MNERRPFVEIIATAAGAVVIAYLTDPEIRTATNAFAGAILYRVRLARWWAGLSGWQQEIHNQRFGRDRVLQPEKISPPSWWKRSAAMRQVNQGPHQDPRPPEGETDGRVA